eukprot:maker-scaffold_9-snap-gene-13.23-mRNA-1 protein AED:0.03 eAED:0.03 QI:7/1/1/1/0/0.5/2/244/221
MIRKTKHVPEEESETFLTPSPTTTFPTPKQKLSPITCFKVAGCFMTLIVLAIVYATYFSFTAHPSLSGFPLNTLRVLLLLFLTSYLQIILTDPGTVPEKWNSLVENSSEAKKHLIKDYKTGVYKPPRAMYCSITGRVVLNYDHFCPWVNNAVGYFNRKFFLLFIFYGFLCSSWAVYWLFPYGGSILGFGEKIHHKREKMNSLFGELVLLYFFLVLYIFLLY